MSLLDQGPHTVTVYPQEAYTTSYGEPAYRPAEQGVVVTGCLVTPVSSSRDPLSDRRLIGGARLLARNAPVGPWARVVWDGRSYSVEALQRHTASPQITHTVATLAPEGGNQAPQP